MVFFRIDIISSHIVVIYEHLLVTSRSDNSRTSDQTAFLNVTSDEAWGITEGIPRFLDEQPYRGGSL